MFIAHCPSIHWFLLPSLLFALSLAGQTLKMLVHLTRAKRVLEIGMFTGYGALSMAEGLPEDGCLIACELESYLKDFAQPTFDKSPHGKKIIVKTGSAMDTLKVRTRALIDIDYLRHLIRRKSEGQFPTKSKMQKHAFYL